MVNPADEVSVKRVLNVPKRGIGDASVAQARRVRRERTASRSSTPCVAPTRRASPARPSVASRRSSTCSTPWPRSSPTPTRAPATCCRRRSTASGYLAELEAEDTIEAAEPDREPRRARRGGPRVHRDGRVPRAGRAGGRHRRPPRRRVEDQVVLMTLHSAEGPRVPGRVPRRAARRGSSPTSGRSPSPPRWRRNAASPTSASPGPCSGSTCPTPGAVSCSGRRSTTRRHASSTRSPPALIESKGNVSGRSTYGRQSYRRRDSDYGDPPPYRRGGGGGGDATSTPTSSTPRPLRRSTVTGSSRQPSARAPRRRRRRPTVRNSACASATTSSTLHSAAA